MEGFSASPLRQAELQGVQELRLVLGDQLSREHSWFSPRRSDVLYLLMEVPSEVHFTAQHYQKTLAVFSAMRDFARWLDDQGHRVVYLRIKDPDNRGSFSSNIQGILEKTGAGLLAYQTPDDQRVAEILASLKYPKKEVSSEHYLSDYQDFTSLAKGDRPPKMETFYRRLRKKTGYLMEGGEPWGGRWNYDKENQQGAKGLQAPEVQLLAKDLSPLWQELQEAGVKGFGQPKADQFPWPTNPGEGHFYLDHFLEHKLRNFGTYQDAMLHSQPFLYHSLLSFALNTKMLSPQKVIERSIRHYLQSPESERRLASLEGFVRQILGWREYMRQFYRFSMPELAQQNYFGHSQPLPRWYWTGETKMRCAADAVKGSLENAYAHHIQRLMVTGNLALLLEVEPQEVEAWYYGIYIDAFDWVEKPNTLAMSQYADGGGMATKPYISSGKYIQKMSDHCSGCHYKVQEWEGEKACPFQRPLLGFHWQKRRTFLAQQPADVFDLGPLPQVQPREKRQKIQAEGPTGSGSRRTSSSDPVNPDKST
jgi:deoxyribodipyrimidine photolyase-related protein